MIDWYVWCIRPFFPHEYQNKMQSLDEGYCQFITDHHFWELIWKPFNKIFYFFPDSEVIGHDLWINLNWFQKQFRWDSEFVYSGGISSVWKPPMNLYIFVYFGIPAGMQIFIGNRNVLILKAFTTKYEVLSVIAPNTDFQ